MGFFFLLGLVVGALFGWRLVRRRKKPRFLLHLEYWVYLPGEVLPPQDDVMTALVQPSVGRSLLGPGEALLFSDVRLHIALVLRSKNAHVFRPDLMEPHIEATPEQLEALSAAKSLAKVRFVSEEPVPDRRYLNFLPQAARTLARLGGGTLVYDLLGERLLEAEALQKGDPGPYIRWVDRADGGYVRTHGLVKVGLPEIQTLPISADERWIVQEILSQVADEAWRTGVLPPSAEAKAFDDRFRVDLETGPDGIASARVHRLPGA